MRRLTILLFAVAAWSCASPGTPPGGPEDFDGPNILRVRPDTNAVNVRSGGVTFQFDEVVGERPQGAADLASLFLISPSQGRPGVSWRRTQISVRPQGGFRPNTTYSVTMLPGLSDLEGNVDSLGRTLVFSTGPTIARGNVRGIVFDWLAEKPAPRAFIEAFPVPTARDSARYIAVADSRNPGENPLIALFAPGRANRREAEICQQADNMLARLGLAGREDSSGDMISLGQSKRVAIARAVAGGARILFLDEPLAGLDQQGITDTLSLLAVLVKEHRLTLVIVEHVFNFTHLHHLVNVHWAIAEGRITRETATPIPQEDSIDGIPVVTRPHCFHLFSQGADVMPTERLPRGAVLTRFRLHGRYLPEPIFAAGAESLEVALFDEADIPWDEIAFRSIALTLRQFFADRSRGAYAFRTYDLSPRDKY